jgi:hypothetical protein
MDEPKEQVFHARFPAKAIAAMTPMIKHVNEIGSSLESFYRQEPTDLMGTYLVPAKEGAFIICTDARNLLLLKCKKAFVKEPFKVNLTNKILKLCKAKEVILSDVDGEPIYVSCTPKPDEILFTEITCLVSPEEYRIKPVEMSPEEAEYWEYWEEGRGILGGFETGRKGNYSDYRKYIAEPAKHLKSILSLLKTTSDAGVAPVMDVGMNLAAFAPISPLVTTLGLQFICRFHGEEKPVEFISVKNEELEYSAYGLSMPIHPQSKGEPADVVSELITS